MSDQRQPTMADIFRSYGSAYIAKFEKNILPSHKRAIKDIIRCRTKDAGGHVYKCVEHDEFDFQYHSCYNRHCPQCQNDQATLWLENEQKRLINVPYFLSTFTLPDELRPFAKSNQKLFYNLLLSESWRAMAKLATDPKWLGGQIGALAVLHTWTKQMNYHPHAHFLTPAGAISEDGSVWIRSHKKFFLPVKALSKIFRAMFRDALQEKAPELFQQIPPIVWQKRWVLHCKRVGNGKSVLKYFAPYLFRVAISNKRIVKLKNGKVTFLYKDTDKIKWLPMTLPVFEFTRRFLQHVLPKGFKKVRHFGFLGSRNKQRLAKLQYAFGNIEFPVVEKPDVKDSIPRCPVCGKKMTLIDIVGPGELNGRYKSALLKAEQVRSP